MQAFNLALSLGFVAWAAAGAASAATGVAVNPVFVGADATCAVPAYDFPVTGTNTINDDGFGNDFVAVIVYDGGHRVLDVDTVSLPVGGTANISYSVTAGLTARPIRVRVHDTSGPVPDSNDGVGTALAAPLLAELEVDPASDSAACAAAPTGPEIRLESTKDEANFTSSALAATLVDSLTVVTPDAAQLLVTYAAECGVNGPETAWLGVRIAVDGVTVAPTGSLYALCSGHGTGAPYPWISARILGGVDVPAGAHTVEVFGDASSGVSDWWLGNRSLSVMVPEPELAGMLAAGTLALAGLRRRRRGPVGSVFRTALVASAALGVLGSAAESTAQTLIDASANPSLQTLSDATPTFLELDTVGSVRVAFTPSRPERIQITVTGECQVVSATDDTTYVALEIVLNGNVLPPTSVGGAFCTSETGIGGHWVGSSVTAVTDLITTGAVRNVQVRARIQGFAAGETARIDDLSVVVVRTPNPVPLF